MLNKYSYSILEFLFFSRVDLTFFMQNNLEEKANLYVPDSKDKLFAVLNRLKNSNLLCVKDIHQDITLKNISYDKNLRKGLYTIEITEKGGDTIYRSKNIPWNEYCNYKVTTIDIDTLKINISLHEKKLDDILEVLDNIKAMKYQVSDLEYWYPLYWKRLKKGKGVELVLNNKQFDDELTPVWDKICSYS